MAVDHTEQTRTRPVFRPVTDIFETEQALTLELEIPGVDAESVSVAIEKRILTVTARTKAQAPAAAALIVSEFRLGDYERSFTLADSIDAEAIEAHLRDGVLRLTLPKARPAPAKTIAVKAG